MNRIGAVLGVVLALAPSAVRAQEPRAAVVVQVAGATLYINLGTEDGVRTGDTLVVRRQATAPPAGTLVVIGASPRRSVLTFAATPFAVTRGDTLFVVVAAPTDVVAPTIAVATRESQPRAPPPSRRPRIDGAVGLEMWGSHTETVGLGANPIRTTRDVGMPSIRFNSMVSGERSRFRVNLQAQQRTGPESVWDRHTRFRLYEARYDVSAGRSQFTVGRFYSDFDHQSAFWDGASVRVALRRGVSAGAAAGFEPERGNEEVSFATPKASVFLGTRLGTDRVDLVTDLALTQTLPSDRALRRSGADLAMRLRVGRFSLTHDLELAPPAPSAGWDLSRFVLRGTMPVGGRGYVYASVTRDRFTPLDTAALRPFARRDRATSGYSLTTRNGSFFDVNASVNNPGLESSGYAAGATISVPRVVGGATVSMHASWFDDGFGTGLVASPAIEYRLGAARMRTGYQFVRIAQPLYTQRTHGLDLRIWTPLGTRVNGTFQVSDRIGQNMHSTSAFTGVEVRF
jgi:hypothetical protein